MRALLTVAIVAVIVVIAMALLAHSLKRSTLFFPDRYPAGRWNTELLRVEPDDARIPTSDGVLLHAWHFKTAAPNAPLLIWFHGNGGNLSHRGDIAAAFAERGIAVLLFDYRGYGKSDGSPTEAGLYHDSTAAWDYAVTRLGVEPGRIVLYGESLGGPYAAFVAAERAGACCAVMENSFPSAAAVARSIPIYKPFSIFLSGSLPTTRYLNEAAVPVLVMHGRRDSVIPFTLGVELYEGISTPKRFFVSDTAGHSEIPSVEGERYFAEIASFIAEHRGGR